MPACASWPERSGWLRRALLGLCLLGWLALPAWAGEIGIREARLTPAESGYALSADFEFTLSRRLEEAVARGVVLHFVAEFELTRARWYWFDEEVTRASQTWRLAYHALTRQYRLSGGGLQLAFSSLDDALLPLRRLRGWTVLERGVLAEGASAQAALRLRLDLAQLPKPFQVEALASKEWNLSSDWHTWTFTMPAAEGAR